VAERDYVLGTEDDEVARLGLQHRVWRPRMLDAWARAGISIGQSVLDVGSGPGYATADLAEIVGPKGKVLAIEQSQRFLASLSARVERHRLSNVDALEADVTGDSFGEAFADAAWCRWVLSFLPEPQRAIGNIARALKPGGVAVFHEYGDYGAWQMMPPNTEVDRFRTLVIQSWRDAGGEPDVGLHLPNWLEEQGLAVVELRPLTHIVRRSDFMWQWPAAFMATNAKRLHELGYASAEEAEAFSTALDRTDDQTWMITPLVVEVIARRR
jgi:SAM-dependent methyltransferase